MRKTVHVSQQMGWRSPERRERSFLNQVLYPAEPPLDDDVPLEVIAVGYPERAVNLFGWETHWSIAFFALSLVFAFALKSRFGVI